MLLMQSYLCYCSVRLGVISIAILSMLRNLAFVIVYFINGLEIWEPFENLLEKDAEYKTSPVAKRLISWYRNYPDNLLICLQISSFYSILSSLLCIYGALKLKKWFLLPLIFAEIIFFIKICTLHIVLMIMLKKIINLGILITITLAGSFLVLYFGYNCATCVALFQIINLVNSARYKELYGNDPFHPITSKLNEEYQQEQRHKGTVENVRVLVTPNEHDIDEQKRMAKFGNLWSNSQSAKQPLRGPAIIAVIPVTHLNQNISIRKAATKWWQQHATDLSNDNLNDSMLYRNWQPAEVIAGPKRTRMRIRNQLRSWY